MATTKFNLNIRNGVINTLQNMGPKLEKKYLNSSLRKGAVMVQSAAQERAKSFDDPKTPQMVWKQIAIYTSADLGKQNGGVALQVGVKGGAKQVRGEPPEGKKGKNGVYSGPGAVYYWRFLEFGTSKMAAQPFMRPALANQVGPVTDAIVAGINDGIDQIVASKGSG
jgi:HK97 gp10 family phage protein